MPSRRTAPALFRFASPVMSAPAWARVAAGAAALVISACNKPHTEDKAGAPTGAAGAPAAAAKPVAPEPVKPAGLPPPPDVAAPPADASKTASGLASKVITPGSGKEHPRSFDEVKVHYTGWTTDGKMFDSSVVRGQPASFPLDRVIPGWTEGVQLMVTGEKRRFWIPVELAYNNRPGAPAGMLVFDVELLDIKRRPEPPPAPSDIKEPPKAAKKLPSGLAYRLLRKGTGKEHPSKDSWVEVHYTGWTTDGKMFDSSVVRGEPATFPLAGVIPGWTEGLQLMTVGEKARLWIPGKLAYGDTPTRPGAPAGTLVFDVELISIKPGPGGNPH